MLYLFYFYSEIKNKTLLPMRVKYNRVSTSTQTGERFKLDTAEYGLTLLDTCSGSLRFAERPKGKQVLQLSEAGKIDTVVVEEFSRLGRNASDTLSTLEYFKEKGICVEVLSNGLQSIINGKHNPTFDLVASIYSGIAQQERELLLERTRQGRERAMAKGVRMGRPKGATETKKQFIDKYPQVVKELASGESLRRASKLTGVGLNTVQKVKKIAQELGYLEALPGC